MEITNEVKQRIVAAIAADRENYPSDNRHATALGIAPQRLQCHQAGQL